MIHHDIEDAVSSLRRDRADKQLVKPAACGQLATQSGDLAPLAGMPRQHDGQRPRRRHAGAFLCIDLVVRHDLAGHAREVVISRGDPFAHRLIAARLSQAALQKTFAVILGKILEFAQRPGNRLHGIDNILLVQALLKR